MTKLKQYSVYAVVFTAGAYFSQSIEQVTDTELLEVTLAVFAAALLLDNLILRKKKKQVSTKKK